MTPGYTLRDASLAVDCPECQAEPGGVCLDSNKAVPVHDERIDNLRGLVRQGISNYDAVDLNP